MAKIVFTRDYKGNKAGAVRNMSLAHARIFIALGVATFDFAKAEVPAKKPEPIVNQNLSVAEKYAIENGIDPKSLVGSGKNGNLLKADVVQYLNKEMRS